MVLFYFDNHQVMKKIPFCCYNQLELNFIVPNFYDECGEEHILYNCMLEKLIVGKVARELERVTNVTTLD